MSAYSLVNVHNEWDRLEEVIVGVADNARVPIGDKGLHAIRYRETTGIDSIPSGPHRPDIIKKAAQELELLVEKFTELGVKVRRPGRHRPFTDLRNTGLEIGRHVQLLPP